MFDYDGDGVVSREEFMAGWRDGRRLGDFGAGVGHHGDDEYEYEIHHFERFHNESELSFFFGVLGGEAKKRVWGLMFWGRGGQIRKKRI